MTWCSQGFLLLGMLILGLASLGAYRLPDFYMRMASASKGSGLAIVLMSMAAVFHFQDLEVLIKLGLLMWFMFLSVPVGGHLLGRAAFRNGVPPHPSTQVDSESSRI